jgi:hypothetical protein
MSITVQQLSSSEEECAQLAHKISGLSVELENGKRLLNDEQQTRLVVEEQAKIVSRQVEALEVWIHEHDYATLQRKMNVHRDQVESILKLFYNLHYMD